MRSSTKNRKRLFGIGILLCFVTVGILLPVAVSMAQEGEVVIIGNAVIPDRPLSKTEVQNIFLGKLTKIDSTKITFVILKSGDIHANFLSTHLSRTPDQYTKYWKKLVFSGKGRTPKAFGTEAEVLEYIAQTQGAIGYIGAATAQDLQKENIHKVAVQ
jgi:ABC-type phosphate transport system substrate-binding protein